MVCNLSFDGIVRIGFWVDVSSCSFGLVFDQVSEKRFMNKPFSSCLANSRTALILVDGFHSSTLSMPRHITPELGGVSLLMLG